MSLLADFAFKRNLKLIRRIHETAIYGRESSAIYCYFVRKKKLIKDTISNIQ